MTKKPTSLKTVRVLTGTTVKGKSVKIGQVVEIESKDAFILITQGQAEEVAPEEVVKTVTKVTPKLRPGKPTDSAGNNIDTR